MNMILYWLLRCNFYFWLCHKLAMWPWASHQISLTHTSISEKGYCKALISADDYYTHKSSSFSSLFSSLAISLSFQIWSRKLSGNIENRYCFCGKKIHTAFAMPPSPARQGYLLSCCKQTIAHCNDRGGGARVCWESRSVHSLQY